MGITQSQMDKYKRSDGWYNARRVKCCGLSKNQYAENKYVKAKLIYLESFLYKINGTHYYGNYYEGSVYKLIVINKHTNEKKELDTPYGYKFNHELTVKGHTARVTFSTNHTGGKDCRMLTVLMKK